MANGIRTTNLERQFAIDELIGNITEDGVEKTARIPIQSLTNQLAGSGPFIFGNTIYTLTKGALDAITPENPNMGGVVLQGVAAGYYARVGSAWVKGRGFPDTFAKVTLSGSGSAQTGVVGAGVDPASIEVFFAKVVTPNTGPMPLSISGGPTRQVINLAGNPLSAGEWTGMVMFYLNDANQYQLLIDAGAAASAAASATLAETSAEAAEAFAAAAGSASGLLDRTTVAALIADDVFSYTAGSGKTLVAPGAIITAQGFRYEVAASDAVDAHIETAGGVKLYVSSANPIIRPEMFGALGSALDEMPELQKAINFAAGAGRWLEISQKHWIKVIDGGGPVDIRNGLDVPSNTKIRFVGDGEIKLLPCNSQHYQILNLWAAEDVEICNPNLDGSRDTNAYDPIAGGQQSFGMGICLRSAKRVKITRPRIRECSADAIVVWRKPEPLPGFSSEVSIEDVDFSNCSRQGISVSSVKGLHIARGKIANIGGSYGGPNSGIDIEAEHWQDVLQDVVIEDIDTIGCEGHGIQTFFGHLNANSEEVDVRIVRHRDTGSLSAFRPGFHVSGSRGVVRYTDGFGYGPGPEGRAVIDCHSHPDDGVKTIIERPTIVTAGANKVGILVEAFLNDPVSYFVGNVEIIEPTIYAAAGEPDPVRGIHLRQGGALGIRNISVIDPKLIDVGVPGTIDFRVSFDANDADISGITVLDRFGALVVTETNFTINPQLFPSKVYVSYSGPALQEITLRPVVGATIEIVNLTDAGYGMAIAPQAGARILPVSETFNQSIKTTQRGATVVLRCLSLTEWVIERQSGVWTPIV